MSYQRFAITVPAGMATQIDEACKVEGRNRSEFFREAVRHYMTAKLGVKASQFVMPTVEEESQDDPFRRFSEWGSEADAVYDVLR
jgi:hypothetical protein